MATFAALLTVLGAATFAIIVGWLHTERPDLDHRDKGISHYATGRTYRAMTAAFVALAAGLLGAVVATIERVQSPGLVALAGAAVGLLVVAAAPVAGPGAARWQGPAHTAGALVFFVASTLGATALSTRLGPVAGSSPTGSRCSWSSSSSAWLGRRASARCAAGCSAGASHSSSRGCLLRAGNSPANIQMQPTRRMSLVGTRLIWRR